MSEKRVEFAGIASGDHESPCWDVTAEEFRRVTGREPNGSSEKSYFHPGLYRLYTGVEIPSPHPLRTGKPLRVTVEVRWEGGKRIFVMTTEEV